MIKTSTPHRFWPSRLSTALVSLAALSSAPLASASVLFNGDFETGDLSQWDRTLNETKNGRTNLRVVDAPVYRGNSAAEMVIHEDDRFNATIFRVEVHKGFDTTGEGDETFVSWYFMYPEEAKHWNLIGYWESDKSYDLSMDFRVYPEDDGTTSIAFVSKQESDRDRTEHWRQPLVIGKWHQIAMHVKWSVRADNGRVSVWYDGNSVVDDVALATKNDGNPLFMQIGLMRIRETGPTETIYIDEAIEATTLEEILARPEEFQTEEPGAGGSGGQAAMVAGAGGMLTMAGAGGNSGGNAPIGGMAGGGAGAMPPVVEAAGSAALPSATASSATPPGSDVGAVPSAAGGGGGAPPDLPQMPAVTPPSMPAPVPAPAPGDTLPSIPPPAPTTQPIAAAQPSSSALSPAVAAVEDSDGGCSLAPARPPKSGAWLLAAVGLLIGLARFPRRSAR